MYDHKTICKDYKFCEFIDKYKFTIGISEICTTCLCDVKNIWLNMIFSVKKFIIIRY